MAVTTTGSTGATPAPEPVAAPTGLESLDVRKLGMWAFLGSECVFFASLITTFFVYRDVIISGASGEPLPRDVLGINFTALLAFILVTSSLTMVLSINAATQNKPRTAGLWLLATAILGTFFLAGQTYEFTKLAQEGLTLTSGVFGQCFLTLTGFHGTHVFVGVIWLLACLPRTISGGFNAGNFMGLEMVGLYWHFVDVVWVVIFTLIYLLP
jgi:cytochrome c oxidase subunit 3/cytochrome o ubiquinol oxidase subunit 3